MIKISFGTKIPTISRCLLGSTIQRNHHHRVSQESRRLLSSGSYYDSQSGLHVPVHDETKVSIFLNTTTVHMSNFIPPQLYKEDASSDMPDRLKELQEQGGINGLILPECTLPRDYRNLTTLVNICPAGGFRLFSFSSPPPDASDRTKELLLSVVLPYKPNDDNFESDLKAHAGIELRSTIALGNDCLDKDPVLLANNIASLVDKYQGKIGDYLWITAASNNHNNNNNNKNDDDSVSYDADHVVSLCEELMYLDLPGATVQSRLILDASDEEVVEETLMIGVNKFVIDKIEQMDSIRELVQAQGKTVVGRFE